MWTLALLGIALRIAFPNRFGRLRILLYVTMGWIVIVAIRPLLANLATGGLLLLMGGLAYTSGIGFYLWRKLPYHHAIWHVFVLAGSVFHFLAVLFYVIPIAGLFLF